MNKFSKCLVVSRHKLLPVQEEDVKGVCQEVVQVPELPTEPRALIETIKPYEVIIGTLPLPLIVQVLQAGKKFIAFTMKSLGTYKTEEEAKQVETKYPGRVAILKPSKPEEPYRVTLYTGLTLYTEVKIVSEPLVTHPE